MSSILSCIIEQDEIYQKSYIVLTHHDLLIRVPAFKIILIKGNRYDCDQIINQLYVDVFHINNMRVKNNLIKFLSLSIETSLENIVCSITAKLPTTNPNCIKIR